MMRTYFGLESAQLSSNLKNHTNVNNSFKVEICSYALTICFRTKEKNQENINNY